MRPGLLLLFASLAGSAPSSGSPLEVVPGTVVRWSGGQPERCGLADRRWLPLDGDCLYPVDLLEPAAELELFRWRVGEREARRVRVAAYPYEVQRIQLPDDRMVHLSEEDLARVLAEQKEVEALWQLDGERHFSFPLGAPLASLPAGGRFGAKRIINGEPRSPHSGADYAAPAGTPVLAAARGMVRLTGEHFFAGRSVFLDHGDGLITMYLHLSRIDVASGEPVNRGQRLGAVGSSGRATGPHLHFGVRWRGARVDPRPLLRPPRALPDAGGVGAVIGRSGLVSAREAS